MEQFETSICTVMSFLKEEHFSASVVSLHKVCYQEISEFLSSNKLSYSPDIGYQWIESHHDIWNYRKYTGYRHCIDQLNDVFITGNISLNHLSLRVSAYHLLSTEYKAILDGFMSEINYNDGRYRIACSRFLLYMQLKNIDSIKMITYEAIICFHNDDFHKTQKLKDVYEELIRVFLKYLASLKMCDISLSLTLNKLLINKIIIIPHDNLQRITSIEYKTFIITWPQITSFISELKKARYGKTVIKSTRHILTLLYIFIQMHHFNIACSYGHISLYIKRFKENMHKICYYFRVYCNLFPPPATSEASVVNLILNFELKEFNLSYFYKMPNYFLSKVTN